MATLANAFAETLAPEKVLVGVAVPKNVDPLGIARARTAVLIRMVLADEPAGLAVTSVVETSVVEESSFLRLEHRS